MNLEVIAADCAKTIIGSLGGLIAGTDSHIPKAGGLGMLETGAGGSNVVDMRSGQAWELSAPKIMGVRLTDSLRGRASSKGQ
jgi:aconitase A